MSGQITVGEYLAGYLHHVGIEDYFTVPGDFNLLLLDEMLKNKNIRLIGCCNELNAGYAADGYARAKGIGATVITYSVGGLSAVNAIAGCYAEDQPIIIISGGPNSNSLSRGELLHHSLGELRYDYVRRIFAEITVASVVLQHPSEVVEGIHKAVSAAIAHNKPVYIEIACNIVQEKILFPNLPSLGSLIAFQKSDPHNLLAAVEHAVKMLNDAKSPVIVLGSKLRVACKKYARSINQTIALIEKAQYATALMADAKGLLYDTHPSNIGVYWGQVSIPTHTTADIIESSDAQIFIGPAFSDYATCGGTVVFDRTKMIQVDCHRIQVDDKTYFNVEMLDFVEALTEKVNPNRASLDAYLKKVPEHHQRNSGSKTVWVNNFKQKMSEDPEGYMTYQKMMVQIQKLILDQAGGKKYTILTETGSAWFASLKLQLPQGILHEIQMAYGSIGWSVGATLGYAIAAQKEQRRVVALIGDGSFQLTAQEVSTMIRYHANPIIFLVNNFGYTVEEEIHKGSYNQIKNWDYAGLMEVFSAKEFYGNETTTERESYGKGIGIRVVKNKELEPAIQKALDYLDGPSLIEVCIAPDDCSEELGVFGNAVSKFNSRKDVHSK